MEAEFTPKEDGESLVIAWDLGTLIDGLEEVRKEGWIPVPFDNATVKMGSQFQVRVINKEIQKQFQELKEINDAEAERQAEILKKEKEIAEKEKELGKKLVDFEELFALENNKVNRTQIDKMAQEFGLEIDRRKFKTVEAIVEEFKRLYDKL